MALGFRFQGLGLAHDNSRYDCSSEWLGCGSQGSRDEGMLIARPLQDMSAFDPSVV